MQFIMVVHRHCDHAPVGVVRVRQCTNRTRSVNQRQKQPQQPTTTHHNHNNHNNHNHHKGSDRLTRTVELFLVSLRVAAMAAALAGGPAQRRREGRLRSWLRHERQSVAMVLAEACHHSSGSFPPTLKKRRVAGKTRT